MENIAIIFSIVCKEWWGVLFFLFVESNYWLTLRKQSSLLLRANPCRFSIKKNNPEEVSTEQRTAYEIKAKQKRLNMSLFPCGECLWLKKKENNGKLLWLILQLIE